MPEAEYCGDTREQALMRLAQLELQSTPDSVVTLGVVMELHE